MFIVPVSSTIPPFPATQVGDFYVIEEISLNACDAGHPAP